jgi:hypothetical protein
MVCVALRTGDCDDHVKQCIANKLIELARDGERNPDLLCEKALNFIRGEPAGPPSGAGALGQIIADEVAQGPV